MSASDSSERPDAVALLEEARRSLREELLPALGGADRYQALLIANALGIAAREIAAGPAADRLLEAGLRALLAEPEGEAGELARRLAREIRAGGRDADAGLHKLLLRHAVARLEVANPRVLGGGG